MWALVRAKGSPGATTFGLAAVATLPPGEGLLAELDPAGGDVAVWAQSAYEPPGLLGEIALQDPQASARGERGRDGDDDLADDGIACGGAGALP